MKKTIFFILVLIHFSNYSQDLSQINTDIGLTDSLINKSEIRVYKGFGIGNYTGVFRLYKEKKNWKADYFDHYGKTTTNATRTKKTELKSKDGLEKVWLKILGTRIEDLPDMKEFEWKLKSEPEVQKIKEQIELVWKKIEIIDGESYVVLFRWGENRKRITYWNPEDYLEVYPDIDELLYFKSFLDCIRSEFKFWKNN